MTALEAEARKPEPKAQSPKPRAQSREPRADRISLCTRSRWHTGVEEFLESEEARPLRILAEYLEPLRRFKAQNIQDTVVFFGSARIHSPEQAREALERLERRFVSGAGGAPNPHLERSRKAVEWSRYYEDARVLARMLTEWSTLSRHAASSLRRDLRRWPRHHGGGQSRRRRGRRKDDRA